MAKTAFVLIGALSGIIFIFNAIITLVVRDPFDMSKKLKFVLGTIATVSATIVMICVLGASR